MAKGSGYFEHDAKVRYTEGLIDKSGSVEKVGVRLGSEGGGLAAA